MKTKRLDELVNVNMTKKEAGEIAGIAARDVLQIGNGWITVQDHLAKVEAQIEEGLDAEVVDARNEADTE